MKFIQKKSELLEHDWKFEWKEMPEFVQEKIEPYVKLIVRFDCEDDLQEFAELIQQKLTSKTKSIWYPKLQRGLDSDKVFSNES